MKTTLFLGAMLLCAACSAPQPESLKDVAQKTKVSFKLNVEQVRLLDATNNFGIRLFDAMAQTHPDSSMVLSPMGVAYSLNMLNNGTDGQTLAELCRSLGYKEADLQQINQLCRTFIIGQRKVLTSAANPNDDFMHTANLLATVGEDDVKRPFMSALAENYFAETLSAPTAEGLQQQANQWIRQQTDGMMKQIPLKLSDNARACLVNSIVFRGGWLQKFNDDLTQKEPFFREDGRVDSVWMMRAYDDADVFRGRHDSLFTALRMPYKGQFYMVLLLPNKGQTLSSLRNALSANMLRKLNAGWIKFDKFHIRVPRISLNVSVPLKPLLQRLGIRQVFGPDANLSRMSSEPLQVSDIVQQTLFSLDEDGTTAISATAIQYSALSALTQPREFFFTANRPFLYYILDGFGNICFIGQCCGRSK